MLGAQVLDQIWSQLTKPNSAEHEIKRALETLVRLGEADPGQRLTAILDGAPPEQQAKLHLAVAQLMTEPA